LLQGRDVAAVTAVQFGAGSLAALPFAALHGGLSVAAATRLPAEPALALAALALAGTLVPFWLFAHGQTRVSPTLAGAFVNLEPLVGAVVGWIAFGNVAGLPQIAGAVAVLGGVALSAMPEGATARVEEPLRAGLARLRWAPEGRS